MHNRTNATLAHVAWLAVIIVTPFILFWRWLFNGEVLFWGTPLLQFWPWHKLVKDALNVAFDTATALEIVTFQSEDHREALAALGLFHQAAERQEATAELARDVLRFLFRARHDPALRFAS